MMGSYQGLNRDSIEQSIDLEEDIQLLKNSQVNYGDDQTDSENLLRDCNPFILRETEEK